MSDVRSRRSVASSTRRQQDAELAAAEERRRATAQTAAATARAARLAAAELAAARAEAEAEAAEDAARAAEVEVETLRSSINGSIAGDITADRELEELARGRARERAERWAAAHPHGGGGGPRDRAPADGNLDGRWRAGGSPEPTRGPRRQRGSPSPDRRHGHHGVLTVKMVQYGDDTYDEERAVEKLFRCVPEKYRQIARSIESLLDLSMMSIEEALGRLKVVDGDEPQPLSGPITIGGKLHLTREQWEASQSDGRKGESSPPTGGRKPRKGRGGVERSPVEFATPLSHDGERIDAYHDGEQLRYRTMEDLLGDQPVPGQVPRDLEAQLHLACDDVITGTKDAEVAAFKEEMKATFQMSDLGPLSFYLGIEVHQDDSGITLRQTAYAKRVVELAGLTDCNPALTPMEERLKLSRDSTTEEVDATQYRRLVGSLRYLTHTRPDLAFSVGYVVALSSCEAEYMAASAASTQALWLARLLGDLLGRDIGAVELRVDSKSALALAKNPVFHERSKHIRVRYHFIRSYLEEGSIKASYINTKDQLADLLTKPLGRIKFLELCSRIGMAQLPHKTTHKT
uniref:Reverse transcriptase Ty1/copia-type domain-containing protein n=1 Tax=Oryza glaberrima TaxID=4538 RepID=I1QCY1_ORYGL